MAFLQRVIKKWFSVYDGLAVLCCLCMITGYLWSRALLSISVVVFFANSLHPYLFLRHWRLWKRNFFSIACFVFFLSYLVSGFWSTNLHQWWDSVTNKMPFAVVPFAFLSLPLNNRRWQKTIVWFLIGTHFFVVCDSLSALVSHFDYYVQSYNISHSLPTTFYDDHIRFSLSLVATMIIIGYYLFESSSIFKNRLERWLLGFCGVLFFIYLHVLASKTGLLVLYIFLFLFAVYLIKEKAKLRKYSLFLIVALMALPFCLYRIVPTFREKVNYVRYEWHMVTSNDTLYYNLSDAGRIISYKMASKVIAQEPWLGTGAGDIKDEMNEAYRQYYPKIPDQNRLIPHNQYFFDFTALGFVFGMSILVLCLASFLFFPSPVFYGRVTSVIMIVAMLAEAMLEIQFGVFIFLFFLLFWRRFSALPENPG